MAGSTPRYELFFEERNDYLFAKLLADEMDEQIAREYFSRIAAEATRLGYKRILLLRDVPAAMGLGTLHQTSADMVPLMAGKQVAFVNPYADVHEDMEFAMTVSTNRGANYRLFAAIKEAELWLLAKNP